MAASQAPLLRAFETLYASVTPATAEALPTVYAEDVVFRDPVHEIHGLAALTRYTRALATDVIECRFDCERWLVGRGEATVCWQITLRHPRLAGGRVVVLPGMTWLAFGDRVTRHEDCYDLGALLYEHVPLLGTAVRLVKRRLARST